MGAIAKTEDAILEAVNATLGNKLRTRGTLPGGWTMDTLRRALQLAPAAYVTWQGGQPGGPRGHLDGRFTLYVVTRGADEENRRRGTQTAIGSYEIVERLLFPLSGLQVPDVGTLHLQGVDNLFRDAMFDLGGTVYGIQLTAPKMPFPAPGDINDLSGFESYSATHVVGGADDPDAEDSQVLPQ